MVNKVFTCVNVLVLLFVVVSGLVKGTLKNWNIDPEEVLHYNGSGTYNLRCAYLTHGLSSLVFFSHAVDRC